jgi:hypothetical protein
MNVTATTNGLSTTGNMHHNGMYDVINLYNSQRPDYAQELIGRTISTKQLYEEIAQWSGLGPAAPMNEASGVPFDTATTPYSKKFYPTIKAIGWDVSDDALETDRYGKLKNFASMAAQSHYVTEQQEAADVINYMTSTSASRLGIDGVALVSTSHPTKTTTWSNRPATDLYLGALALEQAENEMMDQMAYRDYPFPQPGPYKLFVSPANRGLATRLTETKQLPGGNDNDVNAAGRLISKVVVNPFQTQRQYWMLRVAADTGHGLFMLQRRPITIKEGYDIRVPTNVFIATSVYIFGWWMANGIWGSAAA